MKKYILICLSIAICILTANVTNAKTSSNSALTSAIKMYKSQNYSECYTTLTNLVTRDPSNAVAYYYLAMASAQIGKKDEAISNYSKVLELTKSGQLNSYAFRGKTCLETPEQCHDDGATELDNFVHRKYGNGFSNEVRSNYEQQKIENLMREMNRRDNISPEQFKNYKDFSSEVPTNDEIVDALRTLQKAGLSDLIGSNRGEFSFLTGDSLNNNSNAAMFNMLMGGTNSSLSPQVIQSLLTSQMSSGF